MGEPGTAELIEALRESESRFRTAFSRSPVGMAIVSTTGHFVRVNQALCAMFGYARHELLAMSVQEIAHPDDATIDAPHIRRLLDGEIDSYQVEKRYLHHRGKTCWGHLSVSATLGPNGKPHEFVAQIVDITAAKEAETNLRAANARLEALFEHSPAWLSLRDLDGRYLDVNAKLAGLIGSTREEMIGRHASEFTDSGATFQIQEDDRAVLQTREAVVREVNLTDPDGRSHTYHTVRYPVLDEDGEVAAIGSFAMDITERKRADAMRDRALADLNEAQRIAKVGSWSWDAAPDSAVWSDEMFRIYARDPEKGGASEREFLNYVVPEDRRRVAEAYRRILTAGGMFELDYRIVADDGSDRILHALASADPANPGTYRGTVQDVTAIRAAERDIRAVQERFRRAFEDAPVGMAITSASGRFLQVNDALCRMLGYTRDELLAASILEVTAPEEIAQRNRLVDAIQRGASDSYQVDSRLLRRDGSMLWVSRYTVGLRDEQGQTEQLLSHVVDASERRRLEDELRHLADHDPLTGLLNRRGLETQLDRHIAHVRRYGDRGALLLLDLDHFKLVNDTRGHEAGDQLLVAIAAMLRNRLRASDSIARLGGDEFAILLPEADAEIAEQVAHEIVDEIQASPLADARSAELRVTASIGVTTFSQTASSRRAVLVDADLAMYHAKESGRNRVAVNHTAAA